MTLRASKPEAIPAGGVATLLEGNGPPEVSVLMPVFRQEAFVREAVQSILRQEGVTCEVIISDDASNDGTLQAAVDAVMNFGPSPHRVHVRRGEHRLRRDHIPLLAGLASAPVVAQAHGDDISLPDRMATIVQVFRDTRASFVGSHFTTIDASGSVTDDRSGTSGDARAFTSEEAIQRPWWSIGAAQAWRPRAFAQFKPLTTRYAPISHDRILPFRSSLLRSGFVIERSLLWRRDHPDNWHHSLVDDSTPLRRKHGWALGRMIISDVMALDLERAAERGIVDANRERDVRDALDDVRRNASRDLRSAHAELLADGQRLTWRPE